MIEHDREIGVHHRDVVDRAEGAEECVVDRGQAAIEPAVVGEQSDPGIDAQQERGPEGQDDEQQQDVAPGAAGPRDAERHRIADDEAEHGCESAALRSEMR